MATQREKFTAIANAIRGKSHRTSTIVANNFAQEISSLPIYSYQIANPLKHLGYSNLDNAYHAVKTAMTYWNAKNSGDETFAYVDGSGPLKGDTSATLRNSSGNAVIDCSTYIGLVLRGRGYFSSPYHGTTATTYNPRNVTCLTGSQTWTEPYLDLQSNRYSGPPTFPWYTYKTNDGHYRAITASDIAQYYDSMGLFWYASENRLAPQVGDLCFFYKENNDGALTYPNRFLGISHIGIMTSPEHYLNATDYASSGNLIRTAVSVRAPFAYARPFYGALTDGSTTTLSSNGIDLIPNNWSGLRQGSSTINGAAVTLNKKSFNITAKPARSFSRDIVSAACPLYLPAGTYHLSGVVNNTGANTKYQHSYFGVRVYDASSGNGITGTTTTSSGQAASGQSVTQSRTPVWDIGGGAQFTLSSPTYIRLSFYTSKANVACDPVLKKTS